MYLKGECHVSWIVSSQCKNSLISFYLYLVIKMVGGNRLNWEKKEIQTANFVFRKQGWFRMFAQISATISAEEVAPVWHWISPLRSVHNKNKEKTRFMKISIFSGMAPNNLRTPLLSTRNWKLKWEGSWECQTFRFYHIKLNKGSVLLKQGEHLVNMSLIGFYISLGGKYFFCSCLEASQKLPYDNWGI